MENKTRKIYMILILIIVVLVIAVFYAGYINFNKKISASADTLPFLSENEGNIPDAENLSAGFLNSYIMNPGSYSGNISKEKIIGDWILVGEEVNGIMDNESSGSVNFNNAGYFSIVSSSNNFGTYTVENNKIYLNYNDGGEEQIFGKIEGDKLILAFPSYPKIDIYERV